MSYATKSLSVEEVKAMMDTKKSDERCKVLKTFSKLATSRRWLVHNCDIGAISGHSLNSEMCEPVPIPTMRQIMMDFVQLCVDGTKVNGKLNNWNNGCFGSQWLDMDAARYGLDHIRCAFYAKETSADWDKAQPFMVRITVEKAKK